MYMRAVPMGWLGAVDVTQSMARRLVFDTCRVPPGAELRKDKELPEPDIAVVCMDGFGYVERVNLFGSAFNGTGPKRSKEVSGFGDTCRKRGLPLNASRSLIRGLRANTLCGEIDGVSGKVSHSREKSFKFMCKTLALLSLDPVSQSSLQQSCRKSFLSFKTLVGKRWTDCHALNQFWMKRLSEHCLSLLRVQTFALPFVTKLVVQTPPNREEQQLSHQAL